jgi:hypothetical protein
VLVFVVVSFLKHLERREERSNAVIKEIHDEHMYARQESRMAITDNTSAAHANTLAIHAAIAKLSIAIEKATGVNE